MEWTAAPPAKLQDGLRRLRAVRGVVLAVGCSAAYLAVFGVIGFSATHHRTADFFSNTARSWVQIGSLQFSEKGFDRFMGTVFHPLALGLGGLPALLALLGLLLSVLLFLWALVTSRTQSKSDAERLEGDRAYELERKRIEVERSRPVVLAGGSVAIPAAGPVLFVQCHHCARQYTSSSGSCPGCGSPPTG